MGSITETRRSRVWYLLPIFFDIIGGVIAYVALRDDDLKKAKNCLYLGIILTGVWVGLTVIAVLMFGMHDSTILPIVQSV